MHVVLQYPHSARLAGWPAACLCAQGIDITIRYPPHGLAGAKIEASAWTKYQGNSKRNQGPSPKSFPAIAVILSRSPIATCAIEMEAEDSCSRFVIFHRYSPCSATVPVAAHQQEAELQRIEVPGAAFDLVLATPRSPARVVYDLSESPDALIVHLIGDELVLTFEDAEKMLKAVASLRFPAGAFHLVSKDGKFADTVRRLRCAKGRIASAKADGSKQRNSDLSSLLDVPEHGRTGGEEPLMFAGGGYEHPFTEIDVWRPLGGAHLGASAISFSLAGSVSRAKRSRSSFHLRIARPAVEGLVADGIEVAVRLPGRRGPWPRARSGRRASRPARAGSSFGGADD